MDRLSELHAAYDAEIPPAELAAAQYGPGAFEIQANESLAFESWRGAHRMIQAVRGWREIGNHMLAGRCLSSASTERRNAKLYRRLAEDARARSLAWQRRFYPTLMAAE